LNLNNIVLHEFGHALGLDHSTDNADVMYFGENASRPDTELQQSDIESLHNALYAFENPCQTSGSVFAWSQDKD
jgi:predicted Zn-dependent protease